MFESSDKLNFKRIAQEMSENFQDIDKKIKQNCVKSSIVPLNDFYDGFHKEIKEINSEITPSKDRPSIGDYVDIFKAFDTYPANISKPKKPTPKELNRLNSTISKGSTTMDASTGQKDNSYSTLNFSRLANDRLSASEIYQDFIKFKQKLNTLLAELEKKCVSTEYSSKLKQINTFAQQLGKLIPSDGVGEPAFTSIEESKLERIVKNMEEIHFLQNNQEMFNSLNVNSNGSIMRLDGLVEVLSYALNSINCYNSV